VGADGVLRSLLYWCDSQQSPFDLRYLEVPPERFAEASASSGDFRSLPRQRGSDSVFIIGGYLVSVHERTQKFDPRELRGSSTTSVTFTPMRRGESTTLRLPQRTKTVEVVGDELIFFGYRNGDGLSLSRVRLGHEPRVASTITLDQRYLAMGDGRGFSSIVANGSSYLGVPTWRRERYGEHDSDVSFIALDTDGGLRDLGALSGRDPKPHAWWEENARPYFFEGRLFALNGSDIVAGALVDGRAREMRRLDVAGPP